MNSLCSRLGGRYMHSIPFFAFLVESSVYPGAWPFFVYIFAQFTYQKKKKKRSLKEVTKTKWEGKENSPPPT